MKPKSEFIYKGAYSQCLIFTFSKNDFLKEHRATVDVMIVVKKGEVRFEIDGKSIELHIGNHLFIPANEKHAVTAITDSEFYLFKLAPHEHKS